jgi:hypothetical protein
MDIVTLAQEFGLACIQRGNTFYIVGEKEIVELYFENQNNLNTAEETQWQQKIIY